MSDGCKAAGLLVEAHLDGQLDPVKTLEIEQHLDACEDCRERLALKRAMRGSLKKAVQTTTPDDIRARMLAAMAGESARVEARDAATKKAERPAMLRHWRTMVPFASAAALAFAWGTAGNQPVPGTTSDLVKAGFGDEAVLRDLVGLHSKALPPEQTDPAKISQYSQYVGVRVPPPPRVQSAKYVGSRLVSVRGAETAAMHQYLLDNGGRMTLFVYDPRAVQVGARGFVPRALGTSEVRVGHEAGYNVSFTQQGGVGYTVATDADQEQSVKLLAVVEHD
jgi:anti-sigma factor RsiW